MINYAAVSVIFSIGIAVLTLVWKASQVVASIDGLKDLVSTLKVVVEELKASSSDRFKSLEARVHALEIDIAHLEK